MRKIWSEVTGFWALSIAIISIPITLFAAWVTHVIVTIQNEEWIFLLIGALFFPIAIVHGIGVWFGAF